MANGFGTFDLGQIIGTAEAIKSARRQSALDALREQYLGEQIQAAQQSREQQATQFSQDQQIANTRLLNAAAAEVSQNPAAISRWLPQLQQAGIGFEGDITQMPPEQLRQAAREVFESTSHALRAFSGQPEPVQLETIEGPDGSILQRNPLTGELRSVLGREPRPLVSINNQAETSAERAFGEAEGKAFANVLDTGQAAQDKAQSLRALLANPAVTGPTQDFRASANALFADLGIPISPDKINQISNLAQYKGALNQLVLTEQLKQKGPQTESDAKRIQESFGKVTNIQEANQLILNYQLALAERETLLAQMAEEYRQRTGKIEGWRQHLRDYVRKTPLAGYNPKSGRLVFWNEFVDQVREQNPDLSDEQIMEIWRTKYAGR